MTAQSITSPDSGKQYKLWLDSAGKAVGCTCGSREHHPWTPCKHMNKWNQPVLWSEICGHRVKYDVSQHCGCMA